MVYFDKTPGGLSHQLTKLINVELLKVQKNSTRFSTIRRKSFHGAKHYCNINPIVLQSYKNTDSILRLRQGPAIPFVRRVGAEGMLLVEKEQRGRRDDHTAADEGADRGDLIQK